MFNKGQKPRQFTYKPWFYDAEKEEFASRVNQARKHYHGETEGEYSPNKNFDFKGGSRNFHLDRDSRYQTNYGKVNPWRIITFAVILGGLVYYLLFY